MKLLYGSVMTLRVLNQMGLILDLLKSIGKL